MEPPTLFSFAASLRHAAPSLHVLQLVDAEVLVGHHHAAIVLQRFVQLCVREPTEAVFERLQAL